MKLRIQRYDDFRKNPACLASSYNLLFHFERGCLNYNVQNSELAGS